MANGKRGVSLDLARAFAVHHKGDIMAVLTWVNDERAIVFIPAKRSSIAPAWFVLMESAAYKYDNPRYLAQQAAIAAGVLGMDETTSSAARVADMILNYLPDLIRMPSAQPPEKLGAVVGEVRLFADGQEIGGEEVRATKSEITYA